MSGPNKRARAEYSRDPEVWLRWYNELSSGDESNAEDDEDDCWGVEEDNVETSDHDSVSELENSEIEEPDKEKTETVGSAKYYLGKNKTTKWIKTRPNTQVRTRAHNIITNLPGPKAISRDAKSENDCIRRFIDDRIIGIITNCTNIYIRTMQERFSRDRDARLTNEKEMTALIGIFFLIGVLRSSRKNAHQLWDNSKGSGVEACYLTMSEKRFRFLLRCIRFDDVRTREKRREIDKLAPVREVLEFFLTNFQKMFIASAYLTVDEQLLAFRGRCSFKQYIPSKPAKYGMKTFALVDSKTFYTFNLEVYVGTQPDGPYKYSNSPEDVVMRLVEPVAKTNRNITGDNWFTSVSLVKKLLTEKKLTYIGTMRKNKTEIPPEFLPNKQREEHSSMFGFQEDCTIVSYCPKRNKSVILISSLHRDNAIDEESGDKRKPEIITSYNKTKIGVDVVDQLCQKYNVARNTRRWPMVIF